MPVGNGNDNVLGLKPRCEYAIFSAFSQELKFAYIVQTKKTTAKKAP